jgi:hypothetical protein
MGWPTEALNAEQLERLARYFDEEVIRGQKIQTRCLRFGSGPC